MYRIPGAGGLVHVYEHGHAIMDLCLQPVDVLPEGDVVVMHKLMIQGNEDEYLMKANRFAPGIITLRRGVVLNCSSGHGAAPGIPAPVRELTRPAGINTVGSCSCNAADRVDSGGWTTRETDLACHWRTAYLHVRGHGKGDDFYATGVRLERPDWAGHR